MCEEGEILHQRDGAPHKDGEMGAERHPTTSCSLISTYLS